MLSRVGTGVLLALLMLPTAGWALLSEGEQTAKDEGMADYNLGYLLDAIPKLEISAEAGDVEAMYYLGESHRIAHMGMTREALDWYHMAAQQGDPYAMLRLESGNVCTLAEICPDGGDNWAEAALVITLPQAEDGDAEAMGTLFHVYAALGEQTEAIDWLRKASEHGDPISQNLLGGLIRDDEAYIADEAERLEVAEGWVRQAAEQDFIPAMATLSGILRRRNKLEESWKWMVKASEKGYLVVDWEWVGAI
jgi:TPR repeat protein